jgi:hypothetical protein
MNKVQYVDYSSATRRTWIRGQQLHRQKLQEIVRTPSKRCHTPMPKFHSDSKSRQRSERNQKIGYDQIQRANDMLYSKIFDMNPSINARYI